MMYPNCTQSPHPCLTTILGVILFCFADGSKEMQSLHDENHQLPFVFLRPAAQIQTHIIHDKAAFHVFPQARFGSTGSW